MNVITMVLYNRPIYTKTVLKALANCIGINKYRICIYIEPGNEEVISLAKSIDFAETEVNINASRLGIGKNTFQAWENGFKHSDFIIHLEDDTVPSQDCLNYMEYAAAHFANDQSVFSISSYNRSFCTKENRFKIGRRLAYTCWLVGIWRSRWHWAKTQWDPNPGRYATKIAAATHNLGLMEIFPFLSRCQNIGAEGGVHVPSKEWHFENQHTKYWAANLKSEGTFFE